MTSPAIAPDLIRHIEPTRLTLQAIADRMQNSLVSGARSAIAREAGDAAAALFMADGKLIAQARSLPLLLGSLIPAVQATLKAFPASDMQPGDGFLLNDPWNGGAHLPDLTLIRPVFDGNHLIGFGAASLHHQDVGGITPGSIPPNARSIFEEGLRLPPVQSHRAGELEPSIAAILTANSRTPEALLGDLASQWSCLVLGGRELAQLAGRLGNNYSRACQTLIHQSEAMTRAALLREPDGTSEWEDQLDSDGVTTDPVIIRVRIDKTGDHVRIDFTGSSPQTSGPANAAPAAMMAAALYFMRCLAPDAPNNAGCLAPLDLVLPAGSVVNPDYPAAVNARTATVKLACNAIISAWSRDRSATSAAANAGVATVIAFGGSTDDGQRYQLTEIVASGAGGSSFRPGASGLSTDVGNARNTPVEIIERETPIRVESYSFNRGSGGDGQNRGGDGLRRCYLLTEGTTHVSYRGERHNSQARGLQGGLPGLASKAQIIRSNGDAEQLTARTQIQWRAGERLIIETAGAGGWGAVDATPHNPAIRRTEC